MSDLISRRAAIEAVLDRCPSDYDSEYECGYYDALKDAVTRLKDLPSAQPDLQPTCNKLATDCIDRKVAIDAFEERLKTNGYSNVALVSELNRCIGYLMQLPSVQPQRWIPVSERLPDDDTLVLVNYIDHRPDAGDIWIGWHEMENVWYIDGEEHSRERGNEVIAWMPLPEPYKGGTGMKAVFKIRRYTEREVDSLISLMTANGYKVSFEKGDRVTTKVIISKDGQEYIGEDEQ